MRNTTRRPETVTEKELVGVNVLYYNSILCKNPLHSISNQRRRVGSSGLWESSSSGFPGWEPTREVAGGEEGNLKMSHVFQLKTSAKTDFKDITPLVQQAVEKSEVEEGICYVFVPHTTAAVTINENADRHVFADIGMELNHMVPAHERYQHLEGNSPAHIKASLVGSSQVVFVQSKKLVLGTWQGIFFCEFDGPRNRQFYVKVVKAEE